jgi:tRNA(Ile)-lysidine synthase TilS/MesJ
MNELGDELLAIACQNGVFGARIVHLRRHPCLIGTFHDRQLKYAFCGTPSDWRAQRNAIAQFYRYLGVRKPKQSSSQSSKRQRRLCVTRQFAEAALQKHPSHFENSKQQRRIDCNPFAVLAPLRDLLLAAASAGGTQT